MLANIKILLLALPLLSVACTDKEPVATIEPPVPIDSTLTYLALGDSYTIGESVDEMQRYPVQLASQLRQEGIPVNHVRIVAKTGWTTAELKNGISNANLTDSTYSLVSLLIGVNNQYRGLSLDAYKLEFEQLLEQAIAFADGQPNRVFVVSIPDYAFTPFGNGDAAISAEIDAFNAANRAITEEKGILYFDITPISREGLADPMLVANDGLHPSGKQYARWVSLMSPMVKQLLE